MRIQDRTFEINCLAIEKQFQGTFMYSIVFFFNQQNLGYKVNISSLIEVYCKISLDFYQLFTAQYENDSLSFPAGGLHSRRRFVK